MEPERTYVPAAGRHWRLPFYDLIAKLLGADGARRLLVKQTSWRPGNRILEIGCGTGSLVVLIARTRPAGEIVGLDPDPAALAIARRKAARAGAAIRFDEGFANELPYPDASYDLVFSSLMYHHLPLPVKERALREVRRVLKPGGRFHMLDFAGPQTGRHSFIARQIHAPRHLKDNEGDRVIALMTAAGLAEPRLTARMATHLMDVVCYEASAPGA